MKCKGWKKWTEFDDQMLKESWDALAMQDLLQAFPGRSYNSLMLRAGKLGLRSKGARKRKNGSLELLETFTPESFYIWGFIMADGHISDRGDVYLNQHASEFEYLAKLYQQLGGRECDIKHRKTFNKLTQQDLVMLQCRIGHKDVIDRLRPLINLSRNKTYTPPNVDYFCKQDLLIYFLIGLIDGDGSIWFSSKNEKSPTFQIMMHINWIDQLNLLSSKLKEYYSIETAVKISKNGYALLICSNQRSMQLVYELGRISLRMQRKWSKLDTHYN